MAKKGNQPNSSEKNFDRLREIEQDLSAQLKRVGLDTISADHALLRYATMALTVNAIRNANALAAGKGSIPLPESHYLYGEIAKLYHPIRLTIDKVEPTEAWPPSPIAGPSGWSGTVVKVSFTVENRSQNPISGFVTGDVTEGLLTRPLSSTWQQLSATIVGLQPGGKASGTLTLNHWIGYNPSVGWYDLTLQFWIEDPNGTITIVTPAIPGVRPQEAVTYASKASDVADLAFYPSCKPNGPDFIDVSSFTPTPAAVPIDGQIHPVKISWVVTSGGFPAFEKHAGSLTSVTLDGKQVPPTGDETRYIDPRGPIKQIVLQAEGNCGTVTRQITVAVYQIPPKIKTFKADPNYLPQNQTSLIQWEVEDFTGACKVSLKGDQPWVAKNVLVANNLPLKGSIPFVVNADTIVTLTATNPAGTVNQDHTITLAPSPPARSDFKLIWVKITTNKPLGVACHTQTYWANDDTGAEAQANAEWGPDYDVEAIDEADVLTACPL